MPITKKEAIQTMKDFYSLHKEKAIKRSKIKPEKNEKPALFQPKIDESYYQKNIHSVSTIQRWFRRYIQKDQLRPLNPRGLFYKEDFRDFIGNEMANPRVQRSTNFTKAKEVASALNNGELDASVLKIPTDVIDSASESIEILKQLTGKIIYPNKFDTEKITVAPFFALKKLLADTSDEFKVVLLFYAYGNHKITDNELKQLLTFFDLFRLLPTNEIFDLNKNISEAVINYLITFEHKIAEADLRKILDKASEPWLAKDIADLLKKSFEDLPVSKHLYYLLTAYAAGLIDRQQVDTIITLHELVQFFGNKESKSSKKENITDYGGISLIQIINDDGEFTDEFKPYLKYLQFPLHTVASKEETIENFKLYLLGVPKSERFIFSVNKEKLAIPGLTQQFYVSKPGFMGDGPNKDSFIFASGASDAMGIAIFGLEKFNKIQARLGKFFRKDIEASVRDSERFKATPFPGADSTYYVHEQFHLRLFASYHDILHIVLMNDGPFCIHQALNYLGDELRSITKTEWSKEIWEIFDRAFYYSGEPLDENNTAADVFFTYICGMFGIRNFSSQSFIKPELLDNIAILTSAFQIGVNPKKWLEFNIQKSDLLSSSPFRKMIECAIEIKPMVENDSKELQIIKFAIYMHFKNANPTLSTTNIDVKKLLLLLDEEYSKKTLNIIKSPKDNLFKIDLLSYLKENNISDINILIENKLKKSKPD